LPIFMKTNSLERTMKHSSTRNFLRTPGVLMIVALCFALLLSVTIGHSDDRSSTRVRVLVPQSTSALPFLLMAAEHPISNVDLQVDFFVNHAQALALLLRGETDLLLSGTSQGWENRLDGSPIVMIDTGVWGVSSLVGKDPSLTSFATLRGKRLALPFPGSPLDFQSRALLAFEKIDPDKDLTISYGPFPQSVQRLFAGQLDVVALPEPLATTVVKKNGFLRLVQYSQAWARLTGGDGQSPQVSLFSTEGYATDHAELIAALVNAWDAASRKVTANPADAAARFSASLNTEPSILEEAMRNTLLAVPRMAENTTRVLAYYRMVSRYLPAGPRPLDDRFFFVH
jgi:ABC-type nitrate/sulfonate/bicarbonate transport system substrate-binding protein